MSAGWGDGRPVTTPTQLTEAVANYRVAHDAEPAEGDYWSDAQEEAMAATLSALVVAAGNYLPPRGHDRDCRACRNIRWIGWGARALLARPDGMDVNEAIELAEVITDMWGDHQDAVKVHHLAVKP